MPILDVQIVGELPETVSRGLARRIADAVGRVFGSPPGHTWIRLHRISQDDYGENAVEPNDTVQPVFVTILKLELPGEAGSLEEEAAALAEAVAGACGRPAGNVHILYEPPALGRLAFGGRLT